MNALALREDNIDRYMAEISKYPLLTRDEEQALAVRFQDQGDVAAAHKLVVSNLRFVVKIAHEYRGYGLKLTDLIQEGNVGLMLAVKKFDPHKGYRLISYAVWWIRAQIRSFVVRSWSMVKLGTTFAQRKLFFGMRSAKNKLEAELPEGERAAAEDVAKELGVSAPEVLEMEMRLAARDFSLDAKLDDEGRATHVEMLETPEATSQEELLVEKEQHQLLRGKVEKAMQGLNEKERYIVEARLLNEEPVTLQEIGDKFQVSRERVRQLESRVIKKLRDAFQKDGQLELPPSQEDAAA